MTLVVIAGNIAAPQPPSDEQGYYTVTASPGGRSASGQLGAITVYGLANGTSYTFTVTASNDFGTGPPSERARDPVVPQGGERSHPKKPAVRASRGTTPDVPVAAGGGRRPPPPGP